MHNQQHYSLFSDAFKCFQLFHVSITSIRRITTITTISNHSNMLNIWMVLGVFILILQFDNCFLYLTSTFKSLLLLFHQNMPIDHSSYSNKSMRKPQQIVMKYIMKFVLLSSLLITVTKLFLSVVVTITAVVTQFNDNFIHKVSLLILINMANDIQHNTINCIEFIKQIMTKYNVIMVLIIVIIVISHVLCGIASNSIDSAVISLPIHRVNCNTSSYSVLPQSPKPFENGFSFVFFCFFFAFFLSFLDVLRWVYRNINQDILISTDATVKIQITSIIYIISSIFSCACNVCNITCMYLNCLFIYHAYT